MVGSATKTLIGILIFGLLCIFAGKAQDSNSGGLLRPETTGDVDNHLQSVATFLHSLEDVLIRPKRSSTEDTKGGNKNGNQTKDKRKARKIKNKRNGKGRKNPSRNKNGKGKRRNKTRKKTRGKKRKGPAKKRKGRRKGKHGGKTERKNKLKKMKAEIETMKKKMEDDISIARAADAKQSNQCVQDILTLGNLLSTVIRTVQNVGKRIQSSISVMEKKLNKTNEFKVTASQLEAAVGTPSAPRCAGTANVSTDSATATLTSLVACETQLKASCGDSVIEDAALTARSKECRQLAIDLGDAVTIVQGLTDSAQACPQASAILSGAELASVKACRDELVPRDKEVRNLKTTCVDEFAVCRQLQRVAIEPISQCKETINNRTLSNLSIVAILLAQKGLGQDIVNEMDTHIQNITQLTNKVQQRRGRRQAGAQCISLHDDLREALSALKVNVDANLGDVDHSDTTTKLLIKTNTRVRRTGFPDLETCDVSNADSPFYNAIKSYVKDLNTVLNTNLDTILNSALTAENLSTVSPVTITTVINKRKRRAFVESILQEFRFQDDLLK